MTEPDLSALDPSGEGPVVAIPVYAGVSELELGIMVAVCRLCGGEGATRTLHRSRVSILTAGGLVSTPHVMYAALPEPAALLLPGGPGAAKAARDPLLRGFLATHAGLPTGISGSGLLLAGEAGTLQGRILGGPADLTDLLWGFSPAEVRPGGVVTDAHLTTTPGGFPAMYAALAVAGAVWGEAAAEEAAERLGWDGDAFGLNS